MQDWFNSTSPDIHIQQWPASGDNMSRYGANYCTDSFDMSQNGNGAGEIRIDTSNGIMYYWGNRMWNQITQGNIDITMALRPDVDSVVTWAKIKMEEERHAELLKTKYPELKAAHDHYQQLVKEIMVAEKLTNPNPPDDNGIPF